MPTVKEVIRKANRVPSPKQPIPELTPSLFSMRVLGRTDEAVYLRLPAELQQDCGGCSCDICKANPALAKWDTLVVPIVQNGAWEFTHRVHMPDARVKPTFDYWARQKADAKR